MRQDAGDRAADGLVTLAAEAGKADDLAGADREGHRPGMPAPQAAYFEGGQAARRLRRRHVRRRHRADDVGDELLRRDIVSGR